MKFLRIDSWAPNFSFCIPDPSYVLFASLFLACFRDVRYVFAVIDLSDSRFVLLIQSQYCISCLYSCPVCRVLLTHVSAVNPSRIPDLSYEFLTSTFYLSTELSPVFLINLLFLCLFPGFVAFRACLLYPLLHSPLYSGSTNVIPLFLPVLLVCWLDSSI